MYVVTGQEGRAMARLKALSNFLMEKKNCEAKDAFAWMFINYGIRERTTASYLKYMKDYGMIEFEGQTIIWSDKRL